jgi:uncharacterized protein
MNKQSKENYRTQVLTEFASINHAQWQRLLQAQLGNGPCSPFIRYEWLLALEQSKSVGEDTGWQPAHLTVTDANDELVAAMPLYLKYHSYGEYVFDWAWADAYQRSGKPYYPKILGAIPFTPVPGPRLLARDPDSRRALIRGMMSLLRQHDLSSAHVLFLPDNEAAALKEAGWMERHTVQFHWQNPGWLDFEDYLASLTQPKRKKIRAERRKVAEQNIQCERLVGKEITAQDWAFFYRCYANTYQEHRSSPYLTPQFFEQLGAQMGEQCLMVKVFKDQTPVAASLCLFDQDALYGRYWGCVQSLPFVHFEASYYQPITFAIERKLRRFEGGAQGEHKMARGFLPVDTVSMHWLDEPRFAEAVAKYLAREGQGVAAYLDELNERNPFAAPLDFNAADSLATDQTVFDAAKDESNGQTKPN